MGSVLVGVYLTNGPTAASLEHEESPVPPASMKQSDGSRMDSPGKRHSIVHDLPSVWTGTKTAPSTPQRDCTKSWFTDEVTTVA